MLRFVSFALSLTAATSLSAEMATSSGSHLDSWIDCIQFFDHMDTLAKAAGVMSPKNSPAFNPMTCEKAFKSFQHTPRAVDAVVNLAHHLDGEDAGDRASRRLARKAEVEDVALKIRQQHAQHVVTTELFEDQSPRDFMRRLQAIDKLYEFDAANSDATEIANCVVPQDQCPHEACVADYLLQPTYVEFPPAYGGTVGYALGTSLLKDNVLAIALLAPGSAAIIAAAIATAALTDFSLFWTGNAEDRTDTGATGFLEIVKYAQASAEMVLETLCEVIPDDIEVTVIVTCIDVPNPIKAACEGVELILKLSGLVISTLSDQAAFQDSLVDGAEVEAAYEHSRSLLHKQCAIFDEARCRCQDAADPAGTIGMGCDGKDSDCNDFVDDCSE